MVFEGPCFRNSSPARLTVPWAAAPPPGDAGPAQLVMRDIWGLGRDKKKVEAALPSAGVLCTGVCFDIVTAKNFTDAVQQKLAALNPAARITRSPLLKAPGAAPTPDGCVYPTSQWKKPLQFAPDKSEARIEMRAPGAGMDRAGKPSLERRASSVVVRGGGWKSEKLCRDFSSPQGCRFGKACKFSHVERLPVGGGPDAGVRQGLGSPPPLLLPVQSYWPLQVWV